MCVCERAASRGSTWYTWSVVLFLRTLTEMVVLSGRAIRSSMSVTPL